MHERWSGEYEYDIEVLPLVPPMSNWKQPRSEGCAPHSAAAIESSGIG
jgi:hypothetical protein